MPFGGVLQTIFFLSDDKFAFTSPSEEEDEEDTVNAAFGVNFKQVQLKYTQPSYSGWKSVLQLVPDHNGETLYLMLLVKPTRKP